MEPFISEIRLFPYAGVPDGWMPCDGRSMPIAQYTALFSLLGNTYGGDGKTTFALPDMRGLVPAGADRDLPAGRKFAYQRGGADPQSTLALNFCIAWKGMFPLER